MKATNQFIKMAKQADEIQGRWYPEVGDCVSTIDSDTVKGHLIHTPDNNFVSQRINDRGQISLGPICHRHMTRSYYVWLPRIDQLQECIPLPPDELYQRFQMFFQRVKKAPYVQVSDYRAVWLMFVMWEMYRKVWTGNLWQRVDNIPLHSTAEMMSRAPIS